eukprot:1761433-Amphidinium_carterae.1
MMFRNYGEQSMLDLSRHVPLLWAEMQMMGVLKSLSSPGAKSKLTPGMDLPIVPESIPSCT